MSDLSLKPALRFKGFTEAWEQRKLGDICKTYSGGTPLVSNKKFYNGNIPFIRSGEISSDITELFISELGLNNSSAAMVNKGDILYALYGATSGEVAISRVKGAINQAILAILPIKDNNVFITKWLQKNKKKIISTYLQGGQGNLSAEIVKSLILKMPVLNEQAKIGCLFTELDTLITLHQRKYEKLQTIKKGLLEKMFPAEGATMPQIRFKGFTEAWEQRKAKDLCSIATGKSNTQDQVENGIYPFFIRSDLPVKSNKYLYDEEAVITIGDGNIGKVFHYVNGKFDLHQRCYKMADFHCLTAKYFYWYFSTKFYKRAMSMTAKATVDSVRLEMISEMNIKYPKSLEEQNRISGFLFSLDNLITLHQRKCEILKNIKKSLLERMFI